MLLQSLQASRAEELALEFGFEVQALLIVVGLRRTAACSRKRPAWISQAYSALINCTLS